MNTQAIYNEADDGTRINTTVRLLWDDSEPFAELPFRVECHVSGTRLFTAHHATNDAAKADAEKMHAAYLEVHSV